MKKRLFTLSWILMIGMIVGMTACQDEMLSKENFKPSVTLDMERGDLAVFSTSGPLVNPVFMDDGPGGNIFDCKEIGDYEESTGKLDEGDQYLGTDGPISWWTSADGKYVSWTSTVPVKAAFILKGGPGSNVYYYDECTLGDNNLVSPNNPGEQIPGLSNFQICWTECEEEKEDCWKGETAWTDGPRYTNRGNWATYTPYPADNPVTIFAGQTIPVGTATFSPVVDGKVTITINLDADVRLADVKDNVKIQGYASAPSGNPAPGRFANKFTGVTSFDVPAANFYGVHLDVERKVPCD